MGKAVVVGIALNAYNGAGDMQCAEGFVLQRKGKHLNSISCSMAKSGTSAQLFGSAH